MLLRSYCEAGSKCWVTVAVDVEFGVELYRKHCYKMYDLRFSQRWLWRELSSAIWRHVVRWESGDVSVTCSDYSSALHLEAIRSSETSADFQRTTRRHMPEDRILRGYKNWKNILFSVWNVTKTATAWEFTWQLPNKENLCYRIFCTKRE
jgi:hypothetical protein